MGQEVELPDKRVTLMSKDAWLLISSDAPLDFHGAGTHFEFHKTYFALSYIVDDSNRLIGFHGKDLTRGVSVLADFLSLYGPADETKGLDGGGFQRDAYVWSLEGNTHVMLVILYIDKAGETSPHGFVDFDKGTQTVEHYRTAFADLVVLKEGLF